MKRNVPIWDLPLRTFHWLLVLSVVGAYITGTLGGNLTIWHERFGGLILGLLIFRVLWGFVGSEYARFSSFFPTPKRIIAYLNGQWTGIGHNPVGALAIITLLLTLTVQVSTGLFANDDIAFEGPLFHLVDKDVSDKLTGLHSRSFDFLLVVIAIHVSAILFYQWVKKADLVLPMLTGKKRVSSHLSSTNNIQTAGRLRFVLSFLFATTVVWGVWRGDFVDYLQPLASIQIVSIAHT